VSVNDYVLVQGMHDTRAALRAWNRDPWQVLRGWLCAATAVAVGLLTAVYAVSLVSAPDPTPLTLPGLNTSTGLANVAGVLYRNSLVLALHATACIAGFIAGSSLQHSAARRSGLSRVVHEKAGPIAIGIVVAVTCFSLITQAYVLGHGASTIASQLDVSRGALILTLLPHALPELVALFLPLAAWLLASRRDQWQDLLAATFVTVTLAVPVLVVAAFVEVYVWPHLLAAISPLY
jgi:Stage II sporulation protein M